MFASTYKARIKLVNSMKFLACIVMSIIVIGPLLITLFASFKTSIDMVMTSPLCLPSSENIVLDNYKAVFSNEQLFRAMINVTIITGVSLICNVILGSTTAYVLERFDFKCKKIVFGMFFVAMMIPTAITEISRFKVIQSMGLYNTLGAPIAIYIASDLVQLYIYRQFIAQIPIALDESARLDGCSYFQLFRLIIFPLLKPATATLIIIKSINIINDMYVPYLYMPQSDLKTLTTFLMGYANAESGSWQKLSACVIFVMIPSLIIYLLFQKQIIGGLVMGSVKE